MSLREPICGAYDSQEPFTSPNIESITVAAEVISSAIWWRYTALVTVELTWPTASAICSMSTPESDSTETNVWRCSRGVQPLSIPARPQSV